MVILSRDLIEFVSLKFVFVINGYVEHWFFLIVRPTVIIVVFASSKCTSMELLFEQRYC